MKALLIAIAGLTILLLATTVHGDSIDVSLVRTTQTGAPGSSVEFDATLTNLSATDTVYLNGDGSVTISPFLNNFPLFLGPGESSGPFAFFNVLIDPSATPGTYDLNSFTITGGLDGGASDNLGSATFSIIVSGPSTVPEPSPLTLILAALTLAVIALVATHFRDSAFRCFGHT